jgi:alkyldihydroxyacetonephosphate synthase
MKRWNGWGNAETQYPLAENARIYLENIVGTPLPLSDATLEEARNRVPESRLKAKMGIHTDAHERLTHARGQSLPDWVALRSGEVGVYPDAVAYPETETDLEEVLQYARESHAVVIPYGGGSSVLGHINPVSGDRPVLSMDMTRMDKVISVDKTSRLATIQAGAAGPGMEDQLNKEGFTLGHFPQSFEYSTLGGWIVTRSVGQQCYRYGRVDEMFLGGKMLTPSGWLNMPANPASAAGPDLRQVVLGSEGRLGIISQAVMRIHPRPEQEKFRAIFFPHWEAGAAAVREIAQSYIGVSMLRLADAQETATTLQLSGKKKLVGLANRGLKLIGVGEERCLMIYGLTGVADECEQAYDQVRSISRKYSGFAVDMVIGDMWRKTRFLTPYLRNTLWECGYALDTLETSLPWSRVLPAVNAIKSKLETALDSENERVLVFAHLSHLYDVGASTYITYLWRRGAEPAQTLERWQKLKKSASEKIVEIGGTISHQHGVGIDHASYLEAEKGPVGMRMIHDICQSVDPDQMMNPGKLIA